ncbi:MAG TPA: transposase [Verrucomicrobiae bacterium]|nr:transposase [Verrucomicrobiae bacterium]
MDADGQTNSFHLQSSTNQLSMSSNNPVADLGNLSARRRVEIDNNLVENAIRPTAIGKKNWLFVGEAEAGERGAILYTIVESCRRRGIDPYTYLKDVLTRLPRMTNHQVPEVIPAAWAKAHLQVQRQAAS